MNKESKMIRMILFGLSVTSFSIAAGVYIWQLYKTASSMPVFIMLSVFLIFPAMMISRQNSKIVEEKAKAQSEFLSNMSHEIRTPLNGLIGLNHMMMLNIDKVEQEQQKEQVKDWIQKSYGTANYLLSLVNDVLDVSKLQAGKVDLVMEPVMLETMLDAVWSMQHDNIVNRGVEFRIEKEISIPCIETDGTRIKQVLMNIIGNAAKFTPAGGRITLSVSQRRTDKTHVEMQYRCEDTGIGMREEFVEKIFELFSQEQNPASQGVKGTGLGMPLSRLIVESMGGKIHVESKVGRGSAFTVVIPSAIAEAAPDYGRTGRECIALFRPCHISCGHHRNGKYCRDIHGSCHRRPGSRFLVLDHRRTGHCDLLRRMLSFCTLPREAGGRYISGRPHVCDGACAASEKRCGIVCIFGDPGIAGDGKQRAVSFHCSRGPGAESSFAAADRYCGSGSYRHCDRGRGRTDR